jgi:hypothetical protein
LRPFPLPARAAWAKGARAAGLPVNPSLFIASQPIYTARPRFSGMEDPVPTALHAVVVPDSYSDRVSLNATRFEPVSMAAYRTGTAPSHGSSGTYMLGERWRDLLRREVGRPDGFFTPLTAGIGFAAHAHENAEAIIAAVLGIVAERI